MRLVFSAIVLTVPLLSACGPNCQTTCTRIYSSAENGCGIAVPGRDEDQVIRDCVDECEFALARPGEIGDYDPNTRNTSGTAIELQNEKQAAIWMDCVEQTDCVALDDGFCAPI